LSQSDGHGGSKEDDEGAQYPEIPEELIPGLMEWWEAVKRVHARRQQESDGDGKDDTAG
jgi:hypothetical protein